MSEEQKRALAAVDAILYNLPVDGFDDARRLADYAEIWGNAASKAVTPLIAEQIAEAAEEAADDLDMPIMTDYLELRDWVKDQLHALAAKAREIGGVS